jgi:hypothetical protein
LSAEYDASDEQGGEGRSTRSLAFFIIYRPEGAARKIIIPKNLH